MSVIARFRRRSHGSAPARLAALFAAVILASAVAVPTATAATVPASSQFAPHAAVASPGEPAAPEVLGAIIGPASESTAPLRAVTAPADRNSRQMITVSATGAGATTARLTAWQKNAAGQWQAVLGPVTAWVGAGGIGAASEGSTRTPQGDWTLPQAFGRLADPGTALPYFRTDTSDWWDGNVNSPTYNTHVRTTTSPGGASENLYRAGAVYNYAVEIGYNLARTPGKGSAFFLHVSGGEPTAGCVAIPSANLVTLLNWLQPAQKPVIRIGFNLGKPVDDPISNGQFLRVPNGDVYRVAGGAPVYVSSWDAVGGRAAVRDISNAQLAALPRYPADGTYVRVLASGNVYRIAGGAPIYVSTWNALGGRQATVDIDPAAIQVAGRGGKWNHLRQYPVNGTTLRVHTTGQVFQVAGGAPIYVSSYAAVPPSIRPVDIDGAAVINAERGGEWNHLKQVPVTGTFLIGWTSNAVYRVSRGVPIRVTSWAPYGGVQPYTYIDQMAVTKAGTGGVWNHLRRP